MRIGIDIDGVTLEFQDHWIKLYEEWFGLEVDLEQKGEWGCLVSGTHFTDGIEFFDWYDSIDGWATQPLIPGAGGGIDYLVKQHQLVFVTSRHTDRSLIAARNFLARSPWSQNVQLRGKAGNKIGVPTSINIDDSPHVAEAFEEAKRQLVLLDWPWNQDVKESRYIHRVNSWLEALEAVEEFGS